MDTISKEQFNYWKNLDETKYILGLVQNYADECKDMLISGQTVNNPTETAQLIGKIHGLHFVIDIDYQ